MKSSSALAENRRARFNYEILDTYTAGLVLQGWEVKAIRAGKAQLADAYVVIRKGELYLLNVHINPLAQASAQHSAPEPSRSRKLLLNKKEILRIVGRIKEKGLSAVALNLFLANNKIKATVALVRGKKTHDKRKTIERREWKREEARKFRKRF